VLGSGFGVQGLGFVGQGSGFVGQGSGVREIGLRDRNLALGFRLKNLKPRVEGLGRQGSIPFELLGVDARSFGWCIRRWGEHRVHTLLHALLRGV